jgi:outer membrane immunogenic protein
MKALSLIAISAAALALSSPAIAGDKDWSGAYAGVNLGYIWGDATTTDDVKDWGTDKKFIGPFNNSVGGFAGGGTLGYNLQIDRVVLGVEADLDYADLSGSINTPSSQSGNHQVIALDGGFLGALTARAGVLVDPATLIYAKGGLALYTGEATQTTTAKGYETHGTDTFTGWTVGGGVERRITDNISLKLEYAHYEFGTETGDQTSLTDPPVGHVFENHTELTADSVRVGLNYHFN